MRADGPIVSILTLTILAALPSCAEEVGVRKTDDREWFRRENRNALDSTSASERTTQFLRREALGETHRKNPVRVLRQLDRRLLQKRVRLTAFYLSELSYLEAKKTSDPEQALSLYLSAAEYAYAYLFDSELESAPSSYDPFFRWACDLYNRSLARVVTHIAERRLMEDRVERLRTLTGEVDIHSARGTTAGIQSSSMRSSSPTTSR